MKNITILLFVAISSCTLTGCNDINQGLYIIPGVLLFLALVSAYKAVKGYNSGSSQQTKQGIVYSDKKTVPVGQVVFFCMFLLASIGSALWIHSENRPYDPKKDGIPKEAPKDNRESAEEQARIADSVFKIR